MMLVQILLLSTPVLSIKWTYNPGCKNDTMCADANMLHVQSQHNQYLWSTNNGLSSIVFSGANNLSVNWTLYDQNNLSVSTVTPSSFGFTLRNLYIENSTHHNQTIDLTIPTIIWQNVSINSTSSSTNLIFSYINSFMSVQVSLSDKAGRMSKSPHMKYNENDTLIDIMVNMTKIPDIRISNPSLGRIELEVAPSKLTVEAHTRSFDDEATPALFRYDILHSEQANVTSNRSVYAMWRPVVYTNEERTIISSLNTMDITPVSQSPASALLTKYYNVSDVASLHCVFVPPDGDKHLSDSFYWTLAMGVGKPQTETLSTLVSILTLLIIGIPSAALILGVTMIVLKRRSSNPGQGYSAI